MMEKQGIRRIQPVKPVNKASGVHNRRRPREYKQKFRLIPGGLRDEGKEGIES